MKDFSNNKNIKVENKLADQEIERERLEDLDHEPDRESESDRKPGMEKCEQCGQEHEEGEGYDCPNDNNAETIYYGEEKSDVPEKENDEKGQDESEEIED